MPMEGELMEQAAWPCRGGRKSGTEPESGPSTGEPVYPIVLRLTRFGSGDAVDESAGRRSRLLAVLRRIGRLALAPRLDQFQYMRQMDDRSLCHRPVGQRQKPDSLTTLPGFLKLLETCGIFGEQAFAKLLERVGGRSFPFGPEENRLAAPQNLPQLLQYLVLFDADGVQRRLVWPEEQRLFLPEDRNGSLLNGRELPEKVEYFRLHDKTGGGMMNRANPRK